VAAEGPCPTHLLAASRLRLLSRVAQPLGGSSATRKKDDRARERPVSAQICRQQIVRMGEKAAGPTSGVKRVAREFLKATPNEMNRFLPHRTAVRDKPPQTEPADVVGDVLRP